MAEHIDKVAWIHLRDGRVLCARNAGRDVFYLPGGKREGAETDVETLAREVKEELSVDVVTETVQYLGTFSAQAHGHPEGVLCVMACYAADFTGELAVGHEIADFAWFTAADRDRVSDVDRLVFEQLSRDGMLRR